MRKFGVTAGDDLDNLTQVLGEGATKLQGESLRWGLLVIDLYVKGRLMVMAL